MNRKASIAPYRDKISSIHPDSAIDICARIIGDVQINSEASVWPMVVLLTDSEMIRIGRRVGSSTDLSHAPWFATGKPIS